MSSAEDKEEDVVCACDYGILAHAQTQTSKIRPGVHSGVWSYLGFFDGFSGKFEELCISNDE